MKYKIGLFIIILITTFGFFYYKVFLNKQINTKNDYKEIDSQVMHKNIDNNFFNYALKNRYEYGVWLWQSPFQMDEDEIIDLVDNISKNKFNIVYISVDDLLNTPIERKSDYYKKLSFFITQATKKNIFVDVVAGESNWGEPESRNFATNYAKTIIEYNKKHPKSHVHGLQYDVESYLLPKYEINQKEVLTNFVAVVNDVSKLIQSNGKLRLSIVLPHFYDSSHSKIPKVDFNGSKKSVFEQIVSILNNNYNSAVILMAYRNFIDGNNGVEGIVKQEFQLNNSVDMVIAQETGKTNPQYVTFYGKNKQAIINQVNGIYKKFRKYPAFKGIAIHDLNSFQKLK